MHTKQRNSEVLHDIKLLKLSRSLGPYKIYSDILKRMDDENVDYFVMLFNQILCSVNLCLFPFKETQSKTV